ncbi:MAG: proton-conducting transporter membrane subunit [Candidatus Acidiferrales bacterium]
MAALTCLLLVPIVTASLSALPFKSARFAGRITIIAGLVDLMLAAEVARRVLLFGKIESLHGFLVADSLSAVIALLVAFLGFTAGLFSYGYILVHREAHDGARRVAAYFVLYNLFVLSMLAAPLLAHLTLVWVAIELTTLMSAYLVAYVDTPEALEAAWKYVILTSAGAIIGLFGFLLLYWGTQTGGDLPFTWQGLSQGASRIPPAILWLGFLLSLIGFGTKVGLVPLHTWLPDAHSQAPAPVCALLSGIETTTVLYVLMRLFPILEASHVANQSAWFCTVGLLSVGVAAFVLLRVHDYKRMFAASTVEHMGIIMVAVGLGGFPAHFAAIYQVAAHTLTKSLCFFAAGIVLILTGTQEVAKIRGLMRRSPTAAVALLFGGLGIAGAPPFAVFISEFFIFRAAVFSKHYIVVGMLVAFVVMAFCAITFHITGMVFGAGGEFNGHDSPAICSWAIAIAFVPMLILGFYLPPFLQNLFEGAARALGK